MKERKTRELRFKKLAIYRNVQMSFWTDTKVVDEFTPEDKYFYLYLFTNPHTKLCGCYEISKTQMSIELGYSKDTVGRLIERFSSVHKVALYENSTKEILLLNWHKYNWTESDKLRIALSREIEQVKHQPFKVFLEGIFNKEDNVSIPYPYPMDTTVTDTDSLYINNNIKDSNNIPYQKIINLYHENCPSLPKVTKITDMRKKLIKARLKDYSEDELIKAFQLAEASDFLTGRSGKWNGANFDWVMNTNNIVKILEGNYANKQMQSTLTDTQAYAKEHGHQSSSNPDFIDKLEKETREKSKNPYKNYIHGNYDFEQLERELREK